MLNHSTFLLSSVVTISTLDLLQVVALLGTFLMVAMALWIFMIVAMWHTFVKASVPGWAALIPVYSTWKLFEIAGKPGWWALAIIPLQVPLVQAHALILLAAIAVYIVFGIIGAFALAKAFGRSTRFGFLLLLLPPVGFGILAFSRTVEYVGYEDSSLNNLDTYYS